MQKEETYFISAIILNADGSRTWLCTVALLSHARLVTIHELCGKLAKDMNVETSQVSIISINPAPALEPQWRYVEE